MYNIRMSDYVPEPKPATVKDGLTVAAHYYPAWERNASGALHDGFHEIRDYPERTPLMGYYSETDPEVTDWQIKWALEHGVNCWIYCWYRRRENVGHPVTTEALRCGSAIHKGLFGSRYGNLMKFSIMFEVQNKWGASDSRDLLENLMPFWLENYFSRENYLKIDNKPVLFVYDYQNQLANAFGSAEEQRRAFERCREAAKQAGFDGMIFAVEYRKEDLSRFDLYRQSGYDFSFAYCWPVKIKHPSDEEVIAEQLRRTELRIKNVPDNFVFTASCMWDPTPRLVKAAKIEGGALLTTDHEIGSQIWKLQPENYRRLIAEMRRMIAPLPENSYAKKLFMIDNWNEWDEGHYVLPSYEFGFKYLEAIRAELSECDNLPDYRMPADLGFSGYDADWELPDYSDKN